MKLFLSKANGHRGSTLLLTVIVTGLVGFLMAAYLTLVRNQNTTTFRSQNWNAAIAIIEAGLEEALTHLNIHGSTNLACDGWQLFDAQYKMQRTIGDNYYIVAISNYVASASNNSTPVIYSYGYTALPVMAAVTPNTLLAAAGVPDTSKNYLGRGVSITARRVALFTKGVVAKGQIDLNGNNIKTDSFDSSNPDYSTNGLYDASKNKDGGDVATNSGVTNSLNVGNANIKGKISTGPAGSVKIGPNGSVGNKTWHTDPANDGEIQPGWSNDDMNVEFPDVTAPFNGGGFTPSSGTVGGTSYDYVLTNENYQSSSFSMSGNAKMRVTGHAVWYVTGNFSMSGNSYIEISPGASLKLYVGGASASIGGNGILNNAGNALNFMYYGLPSNTSVSVVGNGTIIGTIYAPNADLTLAGGGTSDTDFMGGSVAKTTKMNGHFNFHYDEALKPFGPNRGYVVTSWNELTPDQVLPPGTVLGNYGQYSAPGGN